LCVLKGNDFFCTSQEVYCSTGPTSLFCFPAKGALVNFTIRGVEGKTETEGDQQKASKMEEV